MTFSSFEQNGLKWYNNKLIMVSVLLTGNQLSPTVMRRSHKVKITKKDVYLNDHNLVNDEVNIPHPKKKKRKWKLTTVSPSSESDNSSISKLNWINTLGKKILIDNENENVQVPENNNANYNESEWEVSDFISSEHSSDEWLPETLWN